jgi:radical SAM-linked protein
MSEGHHPRARLSIPVPLSVSARGRNEVADVGLCRWIPPQEVRERLQAEMPEGIGIHAAHTTARHPNRQAKEVAYRVPLLPGHSVTQERVDALLAPGSESRHVRRERKGAVREVDVSKFIKAIRMQDGALLMLIACTQEGTARPDEVLEALSCREGEDFLTGDIERTHVNLSSSSRET